MSMKLSPVMSPASLNFRVQLLILPPNQQSASAKQLTITPSTPLGGNHRGTTIPLTSLLTSCKNGGGVGGTPYHVGRMQHTQDSNTYAWNGCLCSNASKGHSDRMGGNAGPLARASSPRRAPRGLSYSLPCQPNSAPKLEWKKLHRARGPAQARGQVTEGKRLSLSSDSEPPGSTSGSPGPRLGEGREARSRCFPAEGQQQLRRSAAGEGGTQPSPPARPQAGPGPPAPPAATPQRSRG